MQTIKTRGILLVVILLSALALGCTAARDKPSNDNDLHIVFKLDSRLFGPTYGGEHWVPPPYGPIAYSGTYTLQARAYRIDSAGQEYALVAEWIPADSRLVTVSPENASQVTITVHSLGKTSLLVKTGQGETRKLSIKATEQNSNVNVVEITE